MKPTTIAELMKRAREAGHDSLGLANDFEATMALASVQRNTFLRDRTERSLRRWRELVAEVAAAPLPEDRGLFRWLAIEHLRLTAALKRMPLADVSLDANAVRWCEKLDATERAEVTRHFELDMAAPLKAASVGSRG
jgi:hypothetical protein